MPCCVAINCSNRSEKTYRLYRFPRDDRRRAKWVQNMRRGGNWEPSASSYLCEKHFEKSQFENQRLDGKIKLKPNAVPTLFNVPNPPPMIDPLSRTSLYKNADVPCTETSTVVERNAIRECDIDLAVPQNNAQVGPINEVDALEQLQLENQMLREELERAKNNANEVLQLENKNLLKELEKTENALRAHFTDDQIKVFRGERVKEWSTNSIIKAFKFRYALSVKGYDYLRNAGYPLPGYSTLTRHTHN